MHPIHPSRDFLRILNDVARGKAALAVGKFVDRLPLQVEWISA